MKFSNASTYILQSVIASELSGEVLVTDGMVLRGSINKELVEL